MECILITLERIRPDGGSISSVSIVSRTLRVRDGGSLQRSDRHHLEPWADRAHRRPAAPTSVTPTRRAAINDLPSSARKLVAAEWTQSLRRSSTRSSPFYDPKPHSVS
jgi:hypothetical protein